MKAEERARVAREALFGAHFAASAYADRSWAMDLRSGVANPEARLSAESLRADQDLISRALWVSRKVRPMEPWELSLGSEGKNAEGDKYFMRSGKWRAGSMAEALFGVEERPDGTRALHIAFRGTEIDGEGALGTIEGLAGYASPYWNVGRNLDQFEPALSQALDWARDPQNNVAAVRLSGHSLGAGFVEEAFKRHAGKLEGLDAEGYCFGSPGGYRRRIVAPMREFARLVERSVKRLASFFEITPEEARAFGDEPALEIRHSDPKPEPKGDGLRIWQFAHDGDPIPKLGAWRYQARGRKWDWDAESEDLEARAPLRPQMTGFRAHASTGYCVTLEREAMEWAERAGLEVPEEIKELRRARADAVAMEGRIRPEDVARVAREAAEDEARDLERLEGIGSLNARRARRQGEKALEDDPSLTPGRRRVRGLALALRGA